MTDKFHRAARDGNLDMLREATRKDSNRTDEDGMTPTLLAAYTGNLWALRLLISRGGNPDCCDILGMSALHHAAANGHTNCVEYLVSFGCNIWAVDNDMHSAFDHASLHNHQDIVKLLDNVIAFQLVQNRKTAEKLKIKAVVNAEKNQKKYEKLQEETKRRMEKDEKRLITQSSDAENSSAKKIAGGTMSKVFATIRGKKDTVNSTEPRMYSDYLSGSTRSKKVDKKVIETLDNKLRPNDRYGHGSVKSSVIANHGQVIYTNPDAQKQPSTISRSLVPGMYGDESKDGDQYNTGDSGIVSDDGSDCGLFNRPHFGNISFLPKPYTASHMTSLPSNVSDEFTGEEIATYGMSGHTEGYTTVAPWQEKGIEQSDDEVDETEYSDLEMFLSAHNLAEFLSYFIQEKVDFSALLLLTEEDLIAMGLALGPRRKLLDAIMRHKEVIEAEDIMENTHL